MMWIPVDKHDLRATHLKQMDDPIFWYHMSLHHWLFASITMS